MEAGGEELHDEQPASGEDGHGAPPHMHAHGHRRSSRSGPQDVQSEVQRHIAPTVLDVAARAMPSATKRIEAGDTIAMAPARLTGMHVPTRTGSRVSVSLHAVPTSTSAAATIVASLQSPSTGSVSASVCTDTDEDDISHSLRGSASLNPSLLDAVRAAPVVSGRGIGMIVGPMTFNGDAWVALDAAAEQQNMDAFDAIINDSGAAARPPAATAHPHAAVPEPETEQAAPVAKTALPAQEQEDEDWDVDVPVAPAPAPAPVAPAQHQPTAAPAPAPAPRALVSDAEDEEDWDMDVPSAAPAPAAPPRATTSTTTSTATGGRMHTITLADMQRLAGVTAPESTASPADTAVLHAMARAQEVMNHANSNSKTGGGSASSSQAAKLDDAIAALIAAGRGQQDSLTAMHAPPAQAVQDVAMRARLRSASDVPAHVESDRLPHNRAASDVPPSTHSPFHLSEAQKAAFKANEAAHVQFARPWLHVRDTAPWVSPLTHRTPSSSTTATQLPATTATSRRGELPSGTAAGSGTPTWMLPSPPSTFASGVKRASPIVRAVSPAMQRAPATMTVRARQAVVHTRFDAAHSPFRASSPTRGTASFAFSGQRDTPAYVPHTRVSVGPSSRRVAAPPPPRAVTPHKHLHAHRHHTLAAMGISSAPQPQPPAKAAPAPAFVLARSYRTTPMPVVPTRSTVAASTALRTSSYARASVSPARDARGARIRTGAPLPVAAAPARGAAAHLRGRASGEVSLTRGAAVAAVNGRISATPPQLPSTTMARSAAPGSMRVI